MSNLHTPTLALIGLVAGCVSNPSESQANPDSSSFVYARVQYWPGIAETVTLRKSESEVTVVRANGAEQPVQKARDEERSALRRRFGAARPAYAAYLSTAPPKAVLDASVTIDTSAIISTYARQRNGKAPPSAAERNGIVAAYEHDVHEKTAAIASELQRQGFDVRSVDARMPTIFVRSHSAELQALARLPEIRSIGPSHFGAPKNLDVPITLDGDATSWSFSTDPVLHANLGAFTETGVLERIGIVDGGTSGCRLFADHAAFGSNTFVEMASAGDHVSCSSDADCQTTGMAFKCNGSSASSGNPGACDHGTCLLAHGTSVASVFARIATQSAIYHANLATEKDADGNLSVKCSGPDIAKAYEWFESNGVATVNESVACPDVLPGFEDDGAAQDYYAHFHDIFVVEAAGNRKSSPSEEACPAAGNVLCVGGTRTNTTMSCFSSWKNPQVHFPSTSFPATDREEPDVVALAGSQAIVGLSECSDVPNEGLEVAALSGSTDWRVLTGTSFAAPAVTGVAALLHEACRANRGFDPDERFLRAVFRTSAWATNPLGKRYETPVGDDNAKDGAGQMLAAAARSYCLHEPPTEGPTIDSGRDPIDLTHGEPMPGGTIGYADQPLKIKSSAGPLASSRVGKVLTSAHLSAGQRIRFTFVWDSCPSSPEATAPARPEVDFDVFLYNRTTSKYRFASQSADDNTEGFDIDVPDAGDYDIILSWPEGASSCQRPTESTDFEASAWAIAVF